MLSSTDARRVMVTEQDNDNIKYNKKIVTLKANSSEKNRIAKTISAV